MGTSSRKQREIQQREQALLEVARRILIEQGYAGLNMDRLAEATEYSKGVVYQHFSSKEDLIAALAAQSLQRRVVAFQRASRFVGRARERMMAIGVAEELFVRLHPHHFRSEQIIKLADLVERASDERRLALHHEQSACFSTACAIIEDAVRDGDLTLAAGLTPADLLVSLWALTFGAYSVLLTDQPLLLQFGVTAPFQLVRRSHHALLDGFGWQPLSTNWDYEVTRQRIHREIFPQECLEAGVE